MKLDDEDVLAAEDFRTINTRDRFDKTLTPDDVRLSTDTRCPRVYFMLGTYGHIYILFFDPYHELNPLMKPEKKSVIDISISN